MTNTSSEPQDVITREFVRRLLARYASNTDVPEEYGDRTLPLYVLSLQARLGIRPWSDVDLVLKNLPPPMASDAIIRRDGEDKLRSLHINVWVELWFEQGQVVRFFKVFCFIGARHFNVLPDS